MTRTLLCLAFILTAGLALAREQSDAPDAAILGFSPDGRYFAYEQFGFDLASGALSAAVVAIDRQTNGPAPGFPFGVLPDGPNGEVRWLAGGFAADLDSIVTPDGDPDLERIRVLVHEQAAQKLRDLNIGSWGRRLAGVPLTQRSPGESRAAPLVFAVHMTLPSAIPDQQLSYTLDARPALEPEDCVNSDPPRRQKNVTFDVIATQTYPEIKDVGRAATLHSYDMPAGECAVGLWIADVFDPPGSHAAVAVLYMTSSWSSAVDSAAWHGLFVTLPEPGE
jgi:hypothetical protein